MNTIDITNEHCPMTFVKARLALDKLDKGESLAILLKGDEAYRNVPRSARELGYKLLEDETLENDIHRLVFEKQEG